MDVLPFASPKFIIFLSPLPLGFIQAEIVPVFKLVKSATLLLKFNTSLEPSKFIENLLKTVFNTAPPLESKLPRPSIALA